MRGGGGGGGGQVAVSVIAKSKWEARRMRDG